MAADSAVFLQELGARLAQAGLDLSQPFSVAAYNSGAPDEWRLPTSPAGDALGLLIGNTRALFTPFLASLPPRAMLAADPLDLYVERVVAAAINEVSPSVAPLLLVHSHTTRPRAWPMQRICDSVGLARLGPAHLNVHPEHGPWFALRTLVVFDTPPPVSLPPPATRPCDGCSGPCVPALERALGQHGREAGPAATSEVLSTRQLAFLAVRDACPVGAASRYGARQIAYHYARRPDLLYADEPLL